MENTNELYTDAWQTQQFSAKNDVYFLALVAVLCHSCDVNKYLQPLVTCLSPEKRNVRVMFLLTALGSFPCSMLICVQPVPKVPLIPIPMNFTGNTYTHSTGNLCSQNRAVDSVLGTRSHKLAVAVLTTEIPKFLCESSLWSSS